MPRCRICNRHIEETSDQTRAETGIMWKDTKGGVHCLTSDNEYLTMEDSPMHDLATLGEKEGTMPGDSEQPVTLGDLKVRIIVSRDVYGVSSPIPGTRPATVADLVSALRAEGVLDITKLIEYGPSGPQMTFRYVLNLTEDLSAEAQR